MIKGIIFDYGGTIDTNGIHWSEVIWQQYLAANVQINKEEFREAYVHAERTLGKNHIIEHTHTFHRLLEIKISIQADYIATTGTEIDGSTQCAIVKGCYAQVKETDRKSVV